MSFKKKILEFLIGKVAYDPKEGLKWNLRMMDKKLLPLLNPKEKNFYITLKNTMTLAVFLGVISFIFYLMTGNIKFLVVVAFANFLDLSTLSITRKVLTKKYNLK